MRSHAALAAAAVALLILSSPALTEVTVGEESAVVPAPLDRAAELDSLFEALRTAPNRRASVEVSNRIARLWIQSGSDTVDLLMSWATSAMDEEDYPLALDFLDRIVGLAPDYAEGWNRRATVYFMNDDYGPALADLERVLALEPRHFGALAGLGTILRDLGNADQALAAYRQALAIDPYMEHVGEAIEDLENETRGTGL